MKDAAPELEAAIRAKLASGELPSAKPEKVWASKGTGQVCRACGHPIAGHDVEYEVDFPNAPGAMRLHRACIMMWDQLRNEVPLRARDLDPDIA